LKLLRLEKFLKETSPAGVAGGGGVAGG